MEEKAARAYDLAALKYWGPSTHINSPVMIKIPFLISFCSFCLIFSNRDDWHAPVIYFYQLENYQNELEEMKNMTRQEYVAHLRRYNNLYLCRISVFKSTLIMVYLSELLVDGILSSLNLVHFRKSSGFSRGASMYRGVTRSHWLKITISFLYFL